MVFTVLLHPKAAKDLEKTQKLMRPRIMEKLRELREHPERIGKPLRHSDFWSLKIGDYRAIYEIDRDKNQIIILFIGTRKKGL